MKKLMFVLAAVAGGSMAFGAVARVGSSEFDSVADALASIQGETATTVTMLANESAAVEVPSYVTIDMSPNARITGALTGAGEVTLSADSTGSTYNRWFSEGQLTGFNGTVHLRQGRYEAQHNFSHAGLTVKIDNGAQLSTGGTGEWTCAFVVAGTGWTAEPQFAISKAALRIGNSVTGTISAQEGSVVSVGTYNSNNINLSGKITAPNGLTLICNQSDAVITVSGASNEISSTTVTGAGSVALGHQSAIGHTITVTSGATLNLNDKRPGTGNGYALTCEAGAKLRTSNNNYNSTTAVIKSLTLAGDLTIDKPSNMNNMSLGLGIGQNGADKTTLNLGSHTLKLNNGDSFYFRGTTVTGDGTIEVAANQRVIIYQCATTAADATLKIAGNANIELQNGDSALTVKNLILNGNLAMNGSDARPITVTGTLSGTGSIVNLALADGATIDVSEVPENGVVAQATNALTLGSDVKLAINGEVTEAYELTKDGNTVVATPKTEPEPEPDPDYDADMGGTKYTSITEAVLHVSGGATLKVLRPITLTEPLVLDGLFNGVLDLNGFSLTSSGDGDVVSTLEGSVVTITGKGSIVKEGADYAMTSKGLTTIAATTGTPVIGGIVAAPSRASKVSFAYGYYPETPVKTKIDWTGCVSNAKTPVLSVHHTAEHPSTSIMTEVFNPIQEIDGVLYECEYGGGFNGETELIRMFTYLYTVAEVTMDVSENVTIPYVFNVATESESGIVYARIAKATASGTMNGKPLFSYTPMPADINFQVLPNTGYHNPKVMANGEEVTANASGYYHITAVDGGVNIVVTAEEIPMVPSWINSEDSAAVAKYNTWAQKAGVTDPTTAKKAAFAFNCANTDKAVEDEEAAFVITSIEIVDGVPKVTAKMTNLAGEDYLITPVIKGSATVNGKYNLDQNNPDAKFFKAVIGL